MNLEGCNFIITALSGFFLYIDAFLSKRVAWGKNRQNINPPILHNLLKENNIVTLLSKMGGIP